MAESLVKESEAPTEELDIIVDRKFYRKEERVIEISDSDESSDKEDCEGNKRPECAVCLQSCVHPARLPCGHIFCFLCLKGIAHGSKKCAMCRHPIPPDYLDNPDLIDAPTVSANVEEDDGEGYQWFYEGRNGWWQYDRRAGVELESAWSLGRESCELLIAGYLYTVDLKAMVQARRSEPGRRRRIKRDLASSPKKGVAGIRQPELCQALAKLHVEDEGQ